MKILLIFGTRPEAIKMAPVYRVLVQRYGASLIRVCVTAQHREMLDQVLELFSITPDYDLNVMEKNQSLEALTIKLIHGLSNVFDEWRPELVLVQGDTTTAFVGALTAFYKHIRVGHIEAGLRSGNIYAPWPEEMNRKMISQVAEMHFPPTLESKNNLLSEGVDPLQVFVTGNTVIDALFMVIDQINSDKKIHSKLARQFPFLKEDKRCILVTGHRRENFNGGIEGVCRALKELSKRDDVQIVYPVHLNPNVVNPVTKMIGGMENIHLIKPQDYLPFVFLMKQSYLIISDSGGIQEEAPALGVPVLVTRETTERPEGVDAGTVQLVGTDTELIINRANSLLDDLDFYKTVSTAHNPYGDGHAAKRITLKISGDEIDEYE